MFGLFLSSWCSNTALLLQRLPVILSSKLQASVRFQHYNSQAMLSTPHDCAPQSCSALDCSISRHHFDPNGGGHCIGPCRFFCVRVFSKARSSGRRQTANDFGCRQHDRQSRGRRRPPAVSHLCKMPGALREGRVRIYAVWRRRHAPRAVSIVWRCWMLRDPSTSARGLGLIMLCTLCSSSLPPAFDKYDVITRIITS